MRIGIVCPYNYYRPGGVQVCVKEIAHELEKRGHYVRIIAPRPRKLPEKVDPDIILLGGSTEFQTPFATKADISINRSNEKIDALFEEQNFDVLHFHEPGLPVWGMQLLSRSTSANVGTMHATLPEGMVSKSFEKLMKPAARFIEPRLHAITAVSVVAKATAQAYAPQADIEIIPNGIKLTDYLPTSHKKSSKKKTILYIGRLEKRKGVRYLVEAYALLRQNFSDAKLVIAGDGDLRSSLENYVDRHDIPDVSFLGFVSEKKKISLMQNCDLYCSPALYGESFGIVLLEAMAAGTVVVCGNNPGYTSVMTERGKLSLVNPKSKDDFAQRLEIMLYDANIRKLWLQWAKDYVQQFDYKKVVSMYEAAYQKALKTKKAAKVSL